MITYQETCGVSLVHSDSSIPSNSSYHTVFSRTSHDTCWRLLTYTDVSWRRIPETVTSLSSITPYDDFVQWILGLVPRMTRCWDRLGISYISHYCNSWHSTEPVLRQSCQDMTFCRFGTKGMKFLHKCHRETFSLSNFADSKTQDRVLFILSKLQSITTSRTKVYHSLLRGKARATEKTYMRSSVWWKTRT